MLDLRYSSSSVLLYDPQSTLRHNTRVALMNIGFGEVDAVNGREEFLECLEKKQYDVIIADMLTRDGNLNTVVRQMRQSDIGKNPFINIIVTLWDTSPEHVYAGIQAGADDLISRPMSTSQLAERVQGLVVNRKPFIVTEDYIGPERRQIVRGLSEGKLMVVPNSLKAKVENKPEFAATPENIRQTLCEVSDRQVSIYTEQFLRYSSKVVGLGAELSQLEERLVLLIQMQKMNENLMRRILNTEYAHINSLCEAFADVLVRIAKSARELTAQDKELMYQIPFAIHKACKEVRTSAGLAFDIRDVSQQLKQSNM